MFKRVLLPLDGSKLAECVLPHLFAIARIFSPEVHVMRVLEPYSSSSCFQKIDPVDWQICKAEAESYLSVIAARLQEAGIQVSTQLYEGRPGEQVVETARTWDADLILLSSHGQSGLSRWNLSGTALRVVMRANRSLMIIRAYRPMTEDLEDLHYRKIFLPLDGSQRAEMPLALAESIARKEEGDILVALVVRKPEMLSQMTSSKEDSTLVDQLVDRNRAQAEAYLEDLKCRMGMDIQTNLTVSTHINLSLHQIIKENNVDLTLISAHGHSGDIRWPFGSVALGFIIYCSTPLLILQDLPTNRIDLTEAEKAVQETGSH
jgi:nucleotide-binding universal stress UspA family protein